MKSDKTHQRRWPAFSNKRKHLIDVSLFGVVNNKPFTRSFSDTVHLALQDTIRFFHFANNVVAFMNHLISVVRIEVFLIPPEATFVRQVFTK